MSYLVKQQRKKKYTNCFSLTRGKKKMEMSEVCEPPPKMSRVLIYGGCGALGSKCVHQFKNRNWWVANIDFTANALADVNIMVTVDDNITDQQREVLRSISSVLEGHKLDLIVCAAGGWTGGTINENLIETAELMWRKNVWSSMICATIAAKYLRPAGLLVFTGALAALEATPNMIGYGVAKAAVHQLVKSLAETGSGMPCDSVTVALLPRTLDTPMVRKSTVDGDIGSYTPLQFVSDLVLRWSSGKDVPKNGSLCQLITHNFNTDIIML